MSKDTGGPAYPQQAIPADHYQIHGNEGASLRDYFAAHALIALIAAYPRSDADTTAAAAYAKADAMLVERARGGGR